MKEEVPTMEPTKMPHHIKGDKSMCLNTSHILQANLVMIHKQESQAVKILNS